jgi:transposase
LKQRAFLPRQADIRRVTGATSVTTISSEEGSGFVHEILSRNLRDRKAVARYAGLTGSPDESGARRREKGLARAGNTRVRRGMIQLAWRFLMFQKNSALA